MQSRYTQCRTGILALMEPGRLLLWKVGAEAPAYGRWEPIRVPPTSHTLLRSSGVSGHQKAGNTETCLVNEIEGVHFHPPPSTPHSFSLRCQHPLALTVPPFCSEALGESPAQRSIPVSDPQHMARICSVCGPHRPLEHVSRPAPPQP